eukprot:SAG11_NODE_3686_length_2283_cov_3.320055_2_plen_80_part_00
MCHKNTEESHRTVQHLRAAYRRDAAVCDFSMIEIRIETPRSHIGPCSISGQRIVEMRRPYAIPRCRRQLERRLNMEGGF